MCYDGQDGRQLFDTMPHMEADFFFNFLDNYKQLPPHDWLWDQNDLQRPLTFCCVELEWKDRDSTSTTTTPGKTWVSQKQLLEVKFSSHWPYPSSRLYSHIWSVWRGKKQEFMSRAKSVMWNCILESVSMTVTQNKNFNVSTSAGRSSE